MKQRARFDKVYAGPEQMNRNREQPPEQPLKQPETKRPENRPYPWKQAQDGPRPAAPVYAGPSPDPGTGNEAGIRSVYAGPAPKQRSDWFSRLVRKIGGKK